MFRRLMRSTAYARISLIASATVVSVAFVYTVCLISFIVLIVTDIKALLVYLVSYYYTYY